MDLPVINASYFARIGDDHKFPIKFGELANYLTQNKIVSKFHTACSFETLSYAHSKITS